MLAGQITSSMFETKEHDGRVMMEPPGNWYAVRTNSRCEKAVAAHLASRSIEHLLPLCDTVRRWKNGRHRIELPLFPGYLFARLRPSERLRALQVPGFAYLVGTSGSPTPIAQEEIERIQKGLKAGLAIEPYPYLTAGTAVEVRAGAFEGARGFVIRQRGKTRVVISIDLIMRSVAVEVDADNLIPIKRRSAVGIGLNQPRVLA